MAGEVMGATGVEAELIEGGGGVFEVCVDGEAVFRKSEVGRFPRPGEIVELLGGGGA